MSLTAEKERLSRENNSLRDKCRQAEKLQSEDAIKSLRNDIDVLARKNGKASKRIEELEEEKLQNCIQIALLEKEIERLKLPPKEKGELSLDVNKRFLFVCVDEKLCNKLLQCFPNSSIFNYNKMVNVKSIDAIVIITTAVKHREYWPAKNYATRNNIPLLHCPLKNIDGVCNFIAENLC